MNNPLLTLLLCTSNSFSWNQCLIYEISFHKLAVGNVSGGWHAHLSVCSLAPRLFHVHRLSLCTSKTHGCKKQLLVKLDHFLFFMRGGLMGSVKAVTEQEVSTALPLFGNNSFTMALEIPRCWGAGWEMPACGTKSRCLPGGRELSSACAAAGGQWGMRLGGWQNELFSRGSHSSSFSNPSETTPQLFQCKSK